MQEPAVADQPLSEILDELIRRSEPAITIDELAGRFGGRAFGALLFIFALACTLPLPPGASTVFGAPLLLLAPQLMLGRRTPWLPAGLRRRSIRIADLRKSLPGVIRLLRRVEGVSRPRLRFMFSGPGHRAIGLVSTLLACVLVLPIWGGNLLPGAAVAVLSLSMVQRDGAMAVIGYALAVASVSVLVLAFHIIIGVLRHAVELIGGAFA